MGDGRVNPFKNDITDNRVRRYGDKKLPEVGDEFDFERDPGGMRTGHKVHVDIKRATRRTEGAFVFVSAMENMTSGKGLVSPEDSKAKTWMGKRTESLKVCIVCVQDQDANMQNGSWGVSVK